MNNRERVNRAVKFQKPDRVSVMRAYLPEAILTLHWEISIS